MALADALVLAARSVPQGGGRRVLLAGVLAAQLLGRNRHLQGLGRLPLHLHHQGSVGAFRSIPSSLQSLSLFLWSCPVSALRQRAEAARTEASDFET
eukprot:2320129-Rhodomonas_salina.1